MRTDPPFHGDERATLVGFLSYHRETLEMKCAGLDARALAERAVTPSTLSLLGLVRISRGRATTATPTFCASGSTARPEGSPVEFAGIAAAVDDREEAPCINVHSVARA